MLTNLDNVVRYTVSGNTYAITYPYWSTEEIKAYITLSDGTVSGLTYGTDFTVTAPNGVNGTLTKVSAWTDAEKLTIVREVELTQEIDLINGEKIDGEQLETGLDLKTAGLQQLNEKFTRSVMTSIDETGDNMVIPNSTARKGTGDGTLLGFDGTGGNIVLRDLKQFDADVTNTATNASAASASATLAQKWAENPEDTPVVSGSYSALHHANKAKASATSASTDATTATNKALDSEAYAIGKRNGVDVPNTDPAYHNNTKYYYDLVVGAISGALRYQGTWTTTGATDYSGISTPRAKGDLFYCQGTACTIDGVTYTQGDLIIFNQDVASTITTSAIDKIDNTETVTPDNTCALSNKTIAFGSNTMTDVASTNTAQTLTNKTIDSADNTIVIDSSEATLNIDRADVHMAYSTTEQKTGDTFNGLDVYARVINIGSGAFTKTTSSSRVMQSYKETISDNIRIVSTSGWFRISDSNLGYRDLPVGSVIASASLDVAIAGEIEFYESDKDIYVNLYYTTSFDTRFTSVTADILIKYVKIV